MTHTMTTIQRRHVDVLMWHLLLELYHTHKHSYSTNILQCLAPGTSTWDGLADFTESDAGVGVSKK